MKSINKYTLYILFAMLFAISCTKEAEPGILPEISGLENEYITTVNQTLELKSTVKDAPDATYTWLLNGVEESTASSYTFTAPSVSGTHTLVLRVSSSGGMAQKVISIEVSDLTPLYVPTNTLFPLEVPSSLAGKENIKWQVTKAASNLFRLGYSDTGTPLFIAAKTGRYTLKATTPDGLEGGYIALVRTGEEKQTPFIARVFDYLPAPGQFVNELPKYEEGNTHDDMVAKVAAQLVGENATMISLGGWGGYVTFGFDHTIPNVPEVCDFRINGNMFIDNSLDIGGPLGGSAEPGIVMVAYDKNKNGKPDEDEWYEIKGSANFSTEKELWYPLAVKFEADTRTIRDYEVTYYRPKREENDPDYNGGETLIKKYFRWTDNQGVDTFFVKNKWHLQSYYPLWIKEDKLTFKGVRLAANGINVKKLEGGRHYRQYAYQYGYVDNMPNTLEHSAIDIEWAITKDGKPANLPGIDFVKVYCATQEVYDWLGEASTEVGGAYDLHMSDINIKTKKVENEYPVK